MYIFLWYVFIYIYTYILQTICYFSKENPYTVILLLMCNAMSINCHVHMCLKEYELQVLFDLTSLNSYGLIINLFFSQSAIDVFDFYNATKIIVAVCQLTAKIPSEIFIRMPMDFFTWRGNISISSIC